MGVSPDRLLPEPSASAGFGTLANPVPMRSGRAQDHSEALKDPDRSEALSDAHAVM
jgi:hypothetical protein